MELGKEQARDLGIDLALSRGIHRGEAVAVSELLRAKETARLAGFYTLQIYSVLNEVSHGLPPLDLRQLLDNDELPQDAIVQAENILNNPPKERLWISHGLVIAGLCKVLGIHSEKRLIPRFCEIRELDIE
jgi:broad specificity phosphatase PhoE